MSAENPLAFIFPGQGTQRVGMTEALSSNDPEIITIVDRTFEEASEILGRDLKTLCTDGPEEYLDVPGVTEPAILSTSISALRVLGYYDTHPDIVAGHSLGEYSALVAAKSLSFDQAVELVKRRGECMEETKEQNPEGMGMAAVLGMSLQEVESICDRYGVEVANINAPGQVVISGRDNLITAVIQKIGERKVRRLRVGIASHSSLMQSAREKMDYHLEGIDIKDPEIPFVQNITGDYVFTGGEIRDGLSEQMTGRVLWQDSMLRMQKDGVAEYIDVGPGDVLARLVKRIDPIAKASRFEDKIPSSNGLHAYQD